MSEERKQPNIPNMNGNQADGNVDSLQTSSQKNQLTEVQKQNNKKKKKNQ